MVYLFLTSDLESVYNHEIVENGAIISLEGDFPTARNNNNTTGGTDIHVNNFLNEESSRIRSYRDRMSNNTENNDQLNNNNAAEDNSPIMVFISLLAFKLLAYILIFILYIISIFTLF